MKKYIYLIVFILSPFTTKSSNLENISESALKLKASVEMIKGFSIGYGLLTASRVIHELGHALTAKILSNQSINVYLGAESIREIRDPLFNIQGVKIFSPLIVGQYNFTCINKTNNRMKDVVSALAGPLSNIAFLLLAFRVVPLNILSFAMLSNDLMIQVTGSILPYKAYRNDGYNIVRLLGFNKNPFLKILSKKSLTSNVVKLGIGTLLSSLLIHYLYLKPMFHDEDCIKNNIPLTFSLLNAANMALGFLIFTLS